ESDCAYSESMRWPMNPATHGGGVPSENRCSFPAVPARPHARRTTCHLLALNRSFVLGLAQSFQQRVTVTAPRVHDTTSSGSYPFVPGLKHVRWGCCW